MEANAQEVPWQSLYKLMTGSVVPRPIGWISSLDEQGIPNLAPFSFFNVVCANPPHVMFSASTPGDGSPMKDTLFNVRATGEFVVNIVTEKLAEAMNNTATRIPSDQSEFEYAGLTMAPSVAVKPPRVKESPIHFECKVTQIIEISDLPGGANVVIGQVVHMHVDDHLIISGDKIDITRLQPIGRLAGSSYSHVDDIFELIRRPYKPEQ